jgi:type I restriction enzyme S subunit
MAKLGDIATYINGYAFKPQDWSDEGIPIIRIQDLTGNSYQANRYNGEYASKYEVNDGDVLISWSASLGVYIWHGEKAVLNQHIFKVVFDKERISKDFFVHQVGLILENAASDAHGATMKHLTKPVFDALPFYLPPYEKQCEIAEVLDKVTSLISLRKQQLAKLDELVKARFVEMFGDPVTNPKGYEKYKLENLARKISDGVHSKPDYTETGRPFLSVVNINKGVINFKNCKYVSEDAYQKMIKSTHPERGDVLYTKVGATYGIPAYVDTDIAFCLYVSVCLIKPKREVINPRFLSLSMEMPYVKHQADRRIKGIGVPDLHLNQISEFEILCPPLKEQDIFIYFVERLDGEKRVVQQSLDKLELMKKALMQEYFG